MGIIDAPFDGSQSPCGDGAPSSSGVLVSVLLQVVLVGAGGERRIDLAVAANPRGVVVISAFPRVFPASCTGIRVQLDRISTCVRILYYLCLN